jgi:peptidylprolyl isomerase
MIRILAVVCALICGSPAVAQLQLPAGLDPQNTILLDTKNGRVVIKLRSDIAPKHAERIKLLTRDGYYDNVPFHRVIAGFMAQTGDGQNGNGTGRSKYDNLPAEFSTVPFTRGIVGMARNAESIDSANSQFFIMYADGSSLNGKYSVVGEVVTGMEVLDQIKKGEPVRDPDKIWRIQVAVDALKAAAALAQSGPVKALFEKHNLLGTFARDCSDPPSKENPFFVSRLSDDDHMQRDQMSGPATRDFVVVIDKAAELKPNEIAVSGTRDGRAIDGVWRLDQARMLEWELTLAGELVIAGGRILNSGLPTSWLSKCGVT